MVSCLSRAAAALSLSALFLSACTLGDLAESDSLAQATSSGAGGTGGASPAGGAGGLDCAPGRTTADRPDDHAGYQVHVDYVLPSDGVDEALDTGGPIERSVSAFTTWLSGQTGGRALRLDTCGGALDVRFVRLEQSESELKAEGVFIRDAIEDAMKKSGLLSAQKLEAVYYGGDAESVCGSGPWPPALVGHVAAMYLKGTFVDPDIPPCSANPVGASASEPGYIDFAMLHELMHSIGIVPSCAPHETFSGHVSDSPSDLMYAGTLAWQPSALDVGRDDYFEHGNPGCADLARSIFLEPLPEGAEAPPGW